MLGVWDGDWVKLGCLYALTFVTEGVALKGGRSEEVYSAVLVQCLAELFAQIGDLRLGDLLDGSLECGKSEVHGGAL